MTTSTLTFAHADAEFTLYNDGKFEQTDGEELNEVQTAMYNNCLNSVATEFPFETENKDADEVVIVNFYNDGEVVLEYIGEEDNDACDYIVSGFA